MFGFYLALLSYDSCSIYKERTVFWAFYQQASYYVLCAYQFSSVAQSCLFVTAWTAARQASLSITNSQSLLKLTSIKSVMISNISSSVVPFAYLQFFPVSRSFPVNQFFSSGGQSIGVSALASVLPMNTQD